MAGTDTTVAIAAIGLATTTVVGLIWVLKFAATTLSKDIRAHTAAAVEQTKAAKAQKRASDEVLTFMKKLNGKLPKVTIEAIRENHDTTRVR